MEYTDDDLEQSIEETRQEIEEKRASMTEKLELLEERVRDTLEETRSAVEDIVENVKGTVDDTVGAVKETVEGAKSTVDHLVENVKDTVDDTATMVKRSFDLNYQIEHHPWMMFGGSVLLGCLIGSWSNREYSYQREFFERGYHYDDEATYRAPMSNGASLDDLDDTAEADEPVFSSRRGSVGMISTPHTKPRRWSAFTGPFQAEWDALKGIAVGTLMGTLRSMVRQHMPSVAPKLEQAITSASAKLGAEPIDFSVTQQQSHRGNGHSQTQESSTAANRDEKLSSSEAKTTDWQGAKGSTATRSPHSQYR